MIVGSTCSDKSIITIFNFKDTAKVNVGGAFLYEGEEYLVTYVSKENGWCHVDRPMDVKSKPRDMWHDVEYRQAAVVLLPLELEKEEALVTFAEYEKLVSDTAKPEHYAMDPKSPHVPFYSLSEAVDEMGEVMKLAKRAMRTGQEMDRVELALELGDWLWGLTDIARVMGLTLSDVAAINSLKLRRRQQYGKDASVEEEVARVYLNREKETP